MESTGRLVYDEKFPGYTILILSMDRAVEAVEAVDPELRSSTQKKAPTRKEPAAPGEIKQNNQLEQPGEKGTKAPKHAAHNGQTGKEEASEGPEKPAERSLQQGETARKAQGSAVAAEAAAEGKGAGENAAAAAGAQKKTQQKKSIAVETSDSEGMPGRSSPVEREGKTAEGSTEQAQMSKNTEADQGRGEGKRDSGKGKESEAESRPEKAALAETADGSEGNKQAALSGEPKGEGAANEAAAAGKDGGGEAKKPAAVSDEQKAILERGASLMHEADEHDPKGIRLVRTMQVSFLCFRFRAATSSQTHTK
jgi:hypothetical protein